MTLSLYIKQEHIESMELDLSHAELHDQRVNIVREFAGYFKNRYWKDIMLNKDWEIVLTVKSKMNETCFNYA